MPRGRVEAHDRCGVCGELRVVGTCDFGKGNPFFISAPHCRTCCSRPDRSNWRSLAEIEGPSHASESRVRRILRTYASAYAKFLGGIKRSGCSKVVDRA